MSPKSHSALSSANNSDAGSKRQRKKKSIKKSIATKLSEGPSKKIQAGESQDRPIVYEDSDEENEIENAIMSDDEQVTAGNSKQRTPLAVTAPATPTTNLRTLSTLPFSSSFTPYRPSLLGSASFTEQNPIFYGEVTLQPLKKKTLEDLDGMEKPVVRSMVDDVGLEIEGREGRLIDPDQDTDELEALDEVTNTGFAINHPEGSRGESSSKIDLSTADGVETDTPRDASPRRVHLQDGLLLPMNVEVDGVDEDGGEGVKVDQEDLDHIEVIEQGSGMPDRSVPRYFVDMAADGKPVNKNEGVICKRCNRQGHIVADCPHTVCTYCGEIDQHESRACPEQMICFNCGERGHFRQDCKMPRTYQGSCGICKGSHLTKNCRGLWRQYIYLSVTEREDVLAKRQSALDEDEDGWTYHVLGGVYKGGGGLWCCVCAGRGHWGDDCPNVAPPRFPRMIQSTAFSSAIASSGPFAPYFTADTASSNHNYGYGYPSNSNAGNHTRFGESNLPVPRGDSGRDLRGNVGQLGRKKDQQRARERDREALADEDEDDAFDRLAGGSGGRGGGGGGGGGRGRQPPRGPRARPVVKLDGSAGRFGTPGSSGGGDKSYKKGEREKEGRYKERERDGKRDKDRERSRGYDRERERERDRERSPHRSRSRRDKEKERDDRSYTRGGGGGERDDRTNRDYETEWRRNGHGGGSVVGWEREVDEVRGSGGSRSGTPMGGQGGGKRAGYRTGGGTRYHGGY